MYRHLFLAALFLTASLAAQFNGGTYNNFFNLGDYESLDLVPGKKMDAESKAVEDLFEKVLGTQKTNEETIVSVSSYAGKNGQVWKITKVAEGEYVLFNDTYKLAIGIEGSSKNENAKAVPEAYQKDLNSQIFFIERDTINYRFGFYLISKNSGLVLEVDKNSKEIKQKKMTYGNPYQVWAMGLRKKIKNVSTGEYIVPDLSKAILPGAEIHLTKDSKSIYTNWEFINHPAVSGIYFMMNSISKKFLTVQKNETGGAAVDQEIIQWNYDRNGLIIFQFGTVENSSNNYNVFIYPEKNNSFTIDKNKLLIAPLNASDEKQQWQLENGSFTLF